MDAVPGPAPLDTSRASNLDQEGISAGQSVSLPIVFGWMVTEGARGIMGELESYCSALMRRANRGDAAAYRLVLQELAAIFRRSASHRGSNCTLEDIEDAIQETLLALHLKRHTWDESRAFLPWIRAILKNKVTDGLRRRGSSVHLCIDDVAETLADTPIPVARRIDAEAALARLNGRQRDIVVSISVDGGSARQVATRLGMTEVAVRVCLHRALKAMARTFRSDAASAISADRSMDATRAAGRALARDVQASSVKHTMRGVPA